MPHLVHTFLEQVHQGFWNSTAFDAHAGHLLMAGMSTMARPSSSSPNNVDDHQSPPTVLFPEYSTSYSHDKYTIAFPSSQTVSTQDFYINLQPNAIHHPSQLDETQEVYVDGEPCFGEITDESSRRVVD